MSNIFCAVCPENCATAVQYPALAANPDCILQENYVKSQIETVVFAPTGATLPTAVTSAQFLATVDNTTSDNSKLKKFNVEGSMPAATKTLLDLPKGKSINVNREYTQTWLIKDMSDTMYNFLKAVQCGSLNFAFWYADEKFTYPNTTTGITPSFVDVDFPREANKDAFLAASVTVRFKSCGDPTRIDRVF